MARLRDAGWKVLHLPAARCHHRYNQSAGRTPTAAERYAESELRFLAKRYGERFARWAILSRRGPLHPPAEFRPVASSTLFELPHGAWLVEASPLRDFTTSAGSFFEGGELRMPSEILRDYRGEALFVLATERSTGRVGAAVEIKWRR